MYGALLSSQDRDFAVACAVLSYSSFSDAMGHDSALEQERVDHPASIAARRLARHPTAWTAISASRGASIAQTQPASGTMEATHGRTTCPGRAAGKTWGPPPPPPPAPSTIPRSETSTPPNT